MRPKQILKISVDAGMLLLFVLQMAYHITGNTLHEWLGTILFALFILHHIWNLNWYKTLFKGKYSAVRILMTSINVLLFAAMAGMMVSGVMLSREAFGFLNLRAGMFGRRLHMVSTSWGYLLMSAHIGLHFGMIAGMFKKKIKFKSKWLAMTGRISVVLLSAYGICALITRQLADRMFLLMEYAFFDYEEPALFFFADYLCILVLFAAGTYCLSKLPQKVQRSEPR